MPACAGCWRRRGVSLGSGRWSVLAPEGPAEGASAGSLAATAERAEFAARQLLRRTGVVFRRTLARERIPVLWRDVVRACRLLESRGEIRGGRFVAGFDGEQYALPEAVTLLREVRRRGLVPPPCPVLRPGDPLDLRGILTPDPRPSAAPRAQPA
jgi:ATP-dependent helicase Lhr and Lhr-like helicase